MNHSEANLILVHSSLKEVVEKIKPEAPSLKNVLLLGEDEGNNDYPPFERAFKNAPVDLDPTDVSEEEERLGRSSLRIRL